MLETSTTRYKNLQLRQRVVLCYDVFMQPIEHKVKHQYQPTNSSCSPTALSILLGYYGKEFTVEQITTDVPQVKNDQGESFGTINQQLATWCLELGFKVSIYTFDCQVIDLSWAGLPKDKLIERLELRKSGWQVPSLGELWSEAYVQAYIDFLKVGGELHIKPAVTTDLLRKLLQKGPVLPSVSLSTLHGKGRTRHVGSEGETADDINGRAWNHSIVIYGIDSDGNFLIADPLEKPGMHAIEPERILSAISTAQIECDNFLFQLSEI
jgi:hypothetical protein